MTPALGARPGPDGTTFAVWAPDASAVELCLLDDEDRECRLPMQGPQLGVWQLPVPGVGAGLRYGYRADGPRDQAAGHCFNPNRLLLDPYARAVSGELDPSGFPDWTDDSGSHVGWSVVVDDHYDWAGDAPPRTPWADTVVYEAHVRGLTMQHPDVPEPLRGTYAGLAHPATVETLRALGVTAVELLPVHHFVSEPALTQRGLVNYWGYNSLGFFAPHSGYSASGDRGGQVTEFKHLVKTLHRAGIEVLLDVVYNHTAEGGADGHTLCLRGLADGAYYRRRPDGRYDDLTGCGNTLAVAHPAALRLVTDSLRYWVQQMHVDGFRFDLASALARSDSGRPDPRSGLLAAIGQDPVLRQVKLVAEPWDATPEGYLVGGFPPPWTEWNDRYRDTVRDFWRLRSGGVRDLAYRLSGSTDLYRDDGHAPFASINHVTSHDGFTLRDLVSYELRHNAANGEEGRDGHADNRSWNCGVEGETDDVDVVELRRRQAANLLGTLLLSTGVPMLTAGDERGRTQQGNNNAYCHDGPLTWVDWQADPAWAHLTVLTTRLLALRREHSVLRTRRPGDLTWLHPTGRSMRDEDWFDDSLATLGLLLDGAAHADRSFLLWLHAAPTELTVPAPGPGAWEPLVATAGEPVPPTVEAAAELVLPGRSLLLLGSAGQPGGSGQATSPSSAGLLSSSWQGSTRTV